MKHEKIIYQTAFAIAEEVIKNRPFATYKDGVAQAEALAAVEVDTGELDDVLSVIDAMENTFAAYCISINPRWDGSVA